MQTLLQMENGLPVGNALRNVLAEVRAISAQVLDHVHQPTSGTAISRYDPAGAHNRRGWVIKYQDGNLGNLVHELTHAVTHQQYETDGITYVSNNAVTPRTYTAGFPCAGQQLAYCDNEELRQTQFRVPVAENWMTDNTNRIYRWAKQFGLLQAELAQCKERREYGVINIQREYDTLINQMLVWLFEWGYYPLPVLPFPPTPSFALYLEAAVAEAYGRRQNQQAIANQPSPVPEPTPQVIQITTKKWEDDTYMFGKSRSKELKQVDRALRDYHAAVGVAAKFTAAEELKKCFDAWKGLHPNTKRNKGNIVDQLDAQIASAYPF
jgi:hypothetical protein